MTHAAEAVTVRAPARIDLAGGTADIWPICLLEPGAVTVNLAIDRWATARVTVRRDGRFALAATDRKMSSRHADRAALAGERALPLHREVALALAPEGGMEIRTRSGVPAGSGLGGSSTLFVAAAVAAARATGATFSAREFLRLVIDMEARIIGVPTGSQDYVSAMHGGLSAIRFPPGGAVRTAITEDASALRAIASRIVLVWTGLPHDSATNNWAITKAYIDGDAAVRRDMASISAAARDVEAALLRRELDAAGRAVGAEWTARRRLAPGVSTPKIERIGKAAAKAGAISMKVCGAGGGGCVFLWCEEGTRSAVARAAVRAGGEVLRFAPALAGAFTS
jgi:D-glycero-alpha-D-manno-heptose-7-phosphate kinase